MHSHTTFCADIFMGSYFVLMCAPCDKNSHHKIWYLPVSNPNLHLAQMCVAQSIRASNLQHIINLLKCYKFQPTFCTPHLHSLHSLHYWYGERSRRENFRSQHVLICMCMSGRSVRMYFILILFILSRMWLLSRTSTSLRCGLAKFTLPPPPLTRWEIRKCLHGRTSRCLHPPLLLFAAWLRTLLCQEIEI